MTKVYFLLSAFFLTVLTVNAQDMPIDPDTKLIAYSEVVDVSSVSKSDLYVRANTWFTRTFKSAKSVLDLQDKEAGKLIGKGVLPMIIKLPMIGSTDAGTVSMTVTIICKDGKYKYVIDNLNHFRPTGPNTDLWIDGGALEQQKPRVGMMGRPNKRDWSEIKETLDRDLRAFGADLKKAMAKSDADF